MPGFTNTERLAVYTHLRAFESDFDKSQSQMRALCAAWSAAVLGAVALIMINAYTKQSGMSDGDVQARAAHLAYLRAIICMVGSAGVFAFWFIDQRVYQRMIHSIFTYGLFLETKSPDLPQVRTSLYVANLDITHGLALFYRMQFWVFAAVEAVFVWPPFGVDLGAIPPNIKALAWVQLALTIAGDVIATRWSLLGHTTADYAGLAQEMPEKPDWREKAYAWLSRDAEQLAEHLPRILRRAPPSVDQIARRAAWLVRIAAQADMHPPHPPR